jgi:hypothetical protein
MPIDDVAEYVCLVIRSVANAIMIPVGPSVIAPIIATPVLGERVRPFPALRGFERRLPDLIGIPDKRIANKYVLFGAVAQV